jgi:WD40 repeat protein/uncharacterized protein (UPF0147 family)
VAIGRSLAFAPDGKTIAVGDWSDTLCIHDTAQGNLLRELKRDGDNISEIAFSPDGRLLASISNPGNNDSPPGKISLWDPRSGGERHRLKAAEGMVHHVAFSADGKYIAAGGRGKEFLLWETSTGKEINRYSGRREIYSIAFSPDGKSLATHSGAGTIRLWDTATGRVLPVSADPSLDCLDDLRFSANGRRLIGKTDRYIVLDPLTGRELHRFAEPSDWAISHRYSSFSLSPEESLVAEADSKGRIHLRDAATGREVRCLKGHEKWAGYVCFSADGQRLYSTGGDETIRVWEVKTGRCLGQLTSAGTLTGSVAVSPDGRWFASTGDGRASRGITLWDLATGQKKAHFPPRRSQSIMTNHLTFSPDSRLLAAVNFAGCYEPCSVTIWTVPDGVPWRSLEGHKASIFAVAYSSDGRMLATGGIDGTLLLWELASGRLRHQFIGHQGRISSIAFSLNGRLLATASPEAPAFIWDVLGTFDLTPGPLSQDQLRRSWPELLSGDAAIAFQAIRRLAAVPEQTLPFLRQHLKPVSAPDDKSVRQLVDMLDSDDFATRQKAADELEKRADSAVGLLRQILANEKTSLEVHRRLQQIVDALENKPESLRAARAVEVLEWIGTPEAVRLIGELAGVAAEARLSREAVEAKRLLSR